jgi:DNA-directed RNA polymerase subunit RPC12/RpoP
MSKEKQIDTPTQNQLKNSELEQIDELAGDIYSVLHNYSISRVLASVLAGEGYSKQSEGEWIKSPSSYECTACKEEFFVEGYAEDYDPITDWDLHFCPNCGAKMKGGAE